MIRRRPTFAWKRAQAGATAVLAAFAMGAMLVAALLAVEVGRLYSAHRSLQNLASAASMDAVRVVGGCDRVDVPTASEVQQRVADSLVRNSAPADVTVDADDGVGIGYVSTFNNLRELQDSDTDQATAVRVTLTEPFPTPLVPVLFAGNSSRSMTAHAVAVQDVIGTVSIGTSLLTLDSARSALLDSLLTGLLGGNVSLGLVTYQGLANASITLGDLQAAASAADVAALLDASLTRSQALGLLATALATSDDASASSLAGTLNTLAAIADPHASHIKLSDVLAVTPGSEDLAEGQKINALDLTMALTEAAVTGYPINLTVTPMTGITNLSVQLKIGEPPQIGIGPPGYKSDGTPRTQAKTSQVDLAITASVADISNVFPALPATAKFALGAAVHLAAGSAALREVRCAYRGVPHHDVSADVDTSVATVSLRRYPSLSASTLNPQPVGSMLSVPLLMTMSLPSVLDAGELGGETSTEDFEGPFVPREAQVDPDKDVRVVGSTISGAVDQAVTDLASQASTRIVCSAGTLCTALNLLAPAAKLTKVSTLLDPFFDQIASVATGVMDLAGLQVGSATVTMQALVVEQPLVFEKQ